MNKHANYYYDAKIFWAVPANDVKNSEIWIRNTELRNWQLAWKGVAVKSFFEHVDAIGKIHLLAVPVSGTQLIELSPDIKGDFGQSFTARLKTGIIPVNKNHNKFAQINDMFLELGKPLGTIHMDAYGYDYKKEFIFLASMDVIGPSTSNVPWGAPWSTRQWSVVTTVPKLTAPAVMRRRKRVNRLVNNLQFVITITSINDYFEMLEIFASGFLVDVAPPPQWKKGSNSPSISRIIADTLLDEDGNVITDDTGAPILP